MILPVIVCKIMTLFRAHVKLFIAVLFVHRHQVGLRVTKCCIMTETKNGVIIWMCVAAVAVAAVVVAAVVVAAATHVHRIA